MKRRSRGGAAAKDDAEVRPAAARGAARPLRGFVWNNTAPATLLFTGRDQKLAGRLTTSMYNSSNSISMGLLQASRGYCQGSITRPRS